MSRSLSFFAAFALVFVLAGAALASTQSIVVGKPAPAFTYRLIDGKALTPATLRGHRYLLWVMATWCPSCTTGASVVAHHIALLRARHMLVVQMEAAGDLGYPGPSLTSIRDGIGEAARSPNWFWGVLTQEQSLAIDPSSIPDVYYLVDASGRVVAQGSAPGAHWGDIENFAEGR